MKDVSRVPAISPARTVSMNVIGSILSPCRSRAEATELPSSTSSAQSCRSFFSFLSAVWSATICITRPIIWPERSIMANCEHMTERAFSSIFFDPISRLRRFFESPDSLTCVISWITGHFCRIRCTALYSSGACMTPFISVPSGLSALYLNVAISSPCQLSYALFLSEASPKAHFSLDVFLVCAVVKCGFRCDDALADHIDEAVVHRDAAFLRR